MGDVGSVARRIIGLQASLTPIVAADRPVVLSHPGTATPIMDFERYTFTFPEAWFDRIVTSVIVDFARRKKAREEDGSREVLMSWLEDPSRFPSDKWIPSRDRYQLPSWFFPLQHAPRDIEKHLVRLDHRRQLRDRYIAALWAIDDVRRAAWILCRDEFLTSEEAAQMISPAVPSKTARKALRGARPMCGADASQLLHRRDVSSDASKAKAQLQKLLAGFEPLHASCKPAASWPREFLGGPRVHGVVEKNAVHQRHIDEKKYFKDCDCPIWLTGSTVRSDTPARRSACATGRRRRRSFPR